MTYNRARNMKLGRANDSLETDVARTEVSIV